MTNNAPFCALCTSERGPFARRPFGISRALVNVCHRCDEEHPREGGYSFSDRPRASLVQSGPKRSPR